VAAGGSADRIAPVAEHLVLFDGYCGLCDGLVRRLFVADRRGELRFAPLQGTTRREVESRLGRALPEETIVLVTDWRTANARVATRSDAVAAIASIVGGWWRPLAASRILPRRLRDAAYDFVARRRARWFGRLDACRAPTAAETGRFLD
jgi:predicted DCC family thiol-disulfide oxidoreductase YuxK